MRRKETLLHFGGDVNVNWYSVMVNIMKVPQKLKVDLPCDPAVPLLHIYLKEMKPLSQRDTCIPMFIAALFTIAKT